MQNAKLQKFSKILYYYTEHKNLCSLSWPRTRIYFIEKLKNLYEIESTQKDKDNETIRNLLWPFV